MKFQMLAASLLIVLLLFILSRSRRVRASCRIVQNDDLRWVLMIRNERSKPLQIDPDSRAEVYVDGRLLDSLKVEENRIPAKETLVYPLQTLNGNWLRESLMSRAQTAALITLICSYKKNRKLRLTFKHAFNLNLRRFDQINSSCNEG